MAPIRRLRLGAALYVASIQYFLAQLLVARRWSPPYSLARNTISDLGNTACGRYGGRLVCSPLHGVMNASFVVLGAAMVAGSALIWRGHGRGGGAGRATAGGLGLMGASGAGVVLVGLFPENSVPALHGTGAGLSFVLGNAGIIVLGWALRLPPGLRVYSLLSGAGALAALGCFVSGQYLGLGEGGLERVVAYPQTIWLIVIGLYLLRAPQLSKRNDGQSWPQGRTGPVHR
jgi:hypothetical membrane protein